MLAEPPGLWILGVESSVLTFNYYELSEFGDPEAALGLALFISHVSKVTLTDTETVAG